MNILLAWWLGLGLTLSVCGFRRSSEECGDEVRRRCAIVSALYYLVVMFGIDYVEFLTT